VGTTSSARSITVLSNGKGPLQVSNVVATAPFSQTNNCSGPMAPAASCTIQVSFAPPTVVATAAGSITITDNAGTQTVTLSGSGSAPVTFSPTSLSFGNVVQGTSSTRRITLTNRLNTTLTVSAVGVSGPFAVASNTCGATIGAGANCTVGVTFSPTATGPVTGTLTFTDSAVTSPQVGDPLGDWAVALKRV
jgi:hypothetical protein